MGAAMRTPIQIRRLFGLMTLVPSLYGAVQTVCPASYGACTYTDLQIALNSISCGTELDIAPIVWTGNFTYQADCSGNPVVWTSMRKAFLPLSGERLSPAHYYNAAPGINGSSGNIAVLNTANVVSPIQVFAPTKGLHMIGLGFTTSASAAGLTYDLLNLEPSFITNMANASDDIVIDRCYVSGPETAVTTGSNPTKIDNYAGILLQGTNLIVENSTIWNVMRSGGDAQGIAGWDAIGPVTVTNNYISGSGESILTGGNQARYWASSAPHHGVIPVGYTVQFNYLYKPWKWSADAVNNPYFNDYLTFGSYEPCVKNLGENKNGQNILWEYNVHENQWINSSECQGQAFGITLTPRAESGSFVSYTAASGATTTANTLTWTGTPGDVNGNPPQPNGTACILNTEPGTPASTNATVPGTYYVCRNIQSVNLATKTLTAYLDPVTNTGYPVEPVPTSWVFGFDGSESLLNTTVTHDVFRNVAYDLNFQAVEFNPDSSVGTSNYTTPGGISTQNLNISNNLWQTTRVMCYGICNNGTGASMYGANLFSAQYAYEPATRTLATGITISHNTWYHSDAVNNPTSPTLWFALQVGGYGRTNMPPFDGFNFSNNMLPPSYVGYADATSFANNQIASLLSNYATANGKWNNNSMPGGAVTTPCSGGQVCTGNLTTTVGMDSQFFNAASGVMKVAPGSPLAGAGSDGLDIGANFDQLALINGLRVTPGAYSAQLDWDLTSVNNVVPCVVEVSPSRNLFSGLGPYSVVNALNPVYFLQPDTDLRTNPKLVQPIISGTHRTLVIGQNNSVADDNDGTLRNLALNRNQLYWGRLMCGGDTQIFSFTTLSGNDRFIWTNSVDVSLKLQAPPGATQASIAFGPSQSLGQTIGVTPDGSGNVEFKVPVTPGSTTFYQVSFLVGSSTVAMPIGSF